MVGATPPPSAPSPARALQADLSAALAPRQAAPWSERATLTFIAAVCGGFWLAAGLGLHALMG
jgi:hypothetical protein